MTMCFLLRTMLKMLNIKGLIIWNYYKVDGAQSKRGGAKYIQIIWNYYKVDGAQSKRGGAKYIPCISGFCDTSLTECSDYCSPSKAFCRSPISLVKQFSQLWIEQTSMGEH